MQSFVSVVPVFSNGIFRGPFEKEPSLSACSIQGVEIKGGSFTRQVLNQIRSIYEHPLRRAEEKGLSALIDVCVVTLLPGQYCDVPGWHCDGVPRNRYHGQPDWALLCPESFNVSYSLFSEPSGSPGNEFVSCPIKPQIHDRMHVFRDLHREVGRIGPDLKVQPSGVFAWYSPRTIVRTKAAMRRGQHYSFRLTMAEKPPIENRVGPSTIYQVDENGWN